MGMIRASISFLMAFLSRAACSDIVLLLFHFNHIRSSGPEIVDGFYSKNIHFHRVQENAYILRLI